MEREARAGEVSITHPHVGATLGSTRESMTKRKVIWGWPENIGNLNPQITARSSGLCCDSPRNSISKSGAAVGEIQNRIARARD
eukprot:6194581-Pleurochrysis_carterae.AAC.1